MTQLPAYSCGGVHNKTLLGIWIVLAVFSCDKLDIHNSDEFQYPLSLSVEKKQSIAELTWSESTVSSFEEYIILRSIDQIADSPEPEVTGNTVLIARIDERRTTSFKDVDLPIADTVFYKVYARISGRLLMTPTVAFEQSLHLIPARVDIVEPIVARGEFVAFDRATDRLFVYDYNSREFGVSRTFQQLNFPVISYDASTNELLTSENGTTQFLDYSTLNIKQSLAAGSVRDAQYQNGWIYLTHAQFPYSFALYKRSDLSLKDEQNSLQMDWRGFIVIPDATDANKSTIYDFGQTGSARYLQSGSNLDLDLLSDEAFSGSILVAAHPQRTEFVVTNTGIVVDENLQQIAQVENGFNSFSHYAFSPDGSKLFGVTFQNSQMIRMYDVDNDYALLEEYTLNNQISPISMFTDQNNVYLVSLVFLNVSVQTMITTIEY